MFSNLQDYSLRQPTYRRTRQPPPTFRVSRARSIFTPPKVFENACFRKPGGEGRQNLVARTLARHGGTHCARHGCRVTISPGSVNRQSLPVRPSATSQHLEHSPLAKTGCCPVLKDADFLRRRMHNPTLHQLNEMCPIKSESPLFV